MVLVRLCRGESPRADAFPDDLLRGPFDQPWSANDELHRPVWIARTLDALYADGVPFHLLRP